MNDSRFCLFSFKKISENLSIRYDIDLYTNKHYYTLHKCDKVWVVLQLIL